MKLLPLLLSACALLPAFARAEPVTLSFTAEVRNTTTGYPDPGSFISGTFLFDRDPGTYVASSSADGMDYWYGDAKYGMEVRFPSGSPDLSSSGGGISVADHYLYTPEPTDLAFFGTKRNGITYALMLFGPDTSFSGNALPSDDWLSHGWTEGYFMLQDSFHAGSVLSARLTSFTVSTVPEPSTLVLLLAGLGALWIIRRGTVRPAAGPTSAPGGLAFMPG